MKNMIYCFICNLLLVALIILTSCNRQGEVVSVIPAPVAMEQSEGDFYFSEQTCISVDDPQQMQVAGWFARLLETSAGFSVDVKCDDDYADIRLQSDPSMKEEAYRLYVDNTGVEIYASSSPGFFYGLQILRQVLPAAIESDVPVYGVEWKVPYMKVYDAPRFEYRGLMVDVSRYFLPKESLLEIIDCMAMLKLNNLHLHLTDDNGWRLEIKKYPRLTSVGAWRVDRGDTSFPDRVNPLEWEPTPVGGFYTQDDIRQIVAYAAERQINVIPEIDMPAHSNSALAAYPQYACPVVDKYIGVLPGLGGSNADIIYCAGNDAVFDFLKDIVDELCELFPSQYIHLGGDEAWKTYWRICPHCHKRMAEEGLADEEDLQGWFMAQMNDYLKSKGRIMMGWDEVTESTIPDGAVVFGWRDDGQAAKYAAEHGHRFVMTPSELLYLIRYQGPQWFEPLTYFGNSTLSDVYEYEPMDMEWIREYADQMMGIQGSMWTEFCDSPDDVTYQIFPRIAALAEVAWSPSGAKDWEKFLAGLDSFNEHLEEKGVVYSESMYNIQHTVTPVGNGAVAVNLHCERPDVSVRYTVDGSQPDEDSRLFSRKIWFRKDGMLKAATFFDDGRQAGQTLTLHLDDNAATGRKIYSSHPSSHLLINGVAGSLRQTDFEWCHFHSDDSILVDLGKVTDVDEVAVGVLTNYGMAFQKPRYIEAEISSDGRRYTTVGRIEWTDDEIFVTGNFKENVSFAFASSPARYVRILAGAAGKCPDDHIRPGQQAKYCFDEISVSEAEDDVAAAPLTHAGRTGFLLCPPPERLYGETRSVIRFNSRFRKDTGSVEKIIADRSQKNLMRWSDYSSFGAYMSENE